MRVSVLPPTYRAGLAALALATQVLPAGAGLFNNNFNSDPSATVTILEPAKWVPSGGVGGSGYISLTDAVNDQQSAIYIEDLDNGEQIGGFQVTFKMRAGGGSGNAADGWSFCFADDLSGGAFGEEGTGTGLTVTFDIYDNGSNEAPAVDLKLGGVVIQHTLFAKSDILTGNEFVDVRIEYRNGLLDVDFKGQPVYSDVALAWTPPPGARYAFGARTGGENNNHWIDDLRIETFAQTAPAVAAVLPTPQGVIVNLEDAPTSAVNASTVTATFDGAPATLTTTKAGGRTTVVYAGASLLESGTEHTFALTFAHGTPAVTATQNLTLTTPDYAVIPADLALPASSVDTAKRGFVWRVHQVEADSTLPNSRVRAVDQLSGLLGDNVADWGAVGAADDLAAAPNPATAPIDFSVSGAGAVINFSQTEGEENGNFIPDLQMPGMPGLNFSTDNVAAEVLTALEFPAAGSYALVVNSDDGFNTTVGAHPSDAFALSVGGYEGGRGASDTVYHFYVEAAGRYAFQTLWYEGDGGANIEWFSIATDDTRVLINDSAAHPQAIKAYQLRLNALPAYVQRSFPAAGITPLLQVQKVEASLVDAGTTVDQASVKLTLNGTEVPSNVSKSGGVTRLVYDGGLASSTPYTAELTYSDGAGSRTVSWSFNSGLVNEPIFVIEAEDFDYDSGLTNPQKGSPGMDVDVMPYFGGAYDGLYAEEGIDYNNGDGNDSDLYRTELDLNGENEVNISARNNIAAGNGAGGAPGINSSDRLTYTMTQNYGIGWVGGGDWQNYTRTFPSNGKGNWWKVFAGLSYGGTDAGQLSGNLDLVTGGQGTLDQTTERLGQFSAPGSGGWGNNNLVPMTTSSGDPAIVKLQGVQTVRFNMSSGDFDFLIFSTADAPPPSVTAVPQDSGTRTNVVLNWTLTDSDVQVDPASVKVSFNGQDESAKAVTTKTASGATVVLDLSGQMFDAGEYPWQLSFYPVGSPTRTVTAQGTYLVVPYPGEGIFVIEAEDFNYSEDGVTGGKTNPQKGTPDRDVDVMPYLGGAYDQLSAVEGVDYNNGDANDSDLYRTELDENGENEVNIGQGASRYANDRGWFVTDTTYRIGWVANGEWQNYTRTFPDGTFNVWAALSYDGRSPGQLRGSLDLVTSDPTQPDQTVQPLGSFNAPGSGGWGRNELVPMKDSGGAINTVSLGGVQTVRFNLGSGDFDYLLFVPAAAGGPTIEFVRNANGSITLTWEGGGTLEASPTVLGPWTAVPGAASPYTFTPTEAALFGRIRR